MQKQKAQNSKFYTKKELDSIDYVQGNGFYAKYQNKRTKPNIFDTRKKYPIDGHFLRVWLIAKIYCIYLDN